VRQFFASPDAVHTCFWPRKQQQQQQQQLEGKASADQQQQQPQQKQQQQPVWLQIDHAEVQQLHDQLLSCQSDAVRDALAAGCQQLLLHISVHSLSGSRANPGFCRQVGVVVGVGVGVRGRAGVLFMLPAVACCVHSHAAQSPP
jgi:hypothetical protein